MNRILLALTATLLGTLALAAAQPTAVLNDTLVVEGTGGSSTAHFTLTSSVPLPYDVLYDVVIIPGTAVSGDDYTESGATTQFTLHANTTSAVLDVPIVPDDVHEDDEIFSIQITDHNGNGPVLANNKAVCTIVNDDVGFQPDVAGMPVGYVSVVHFDVGLALTHDETVTFSSSNPEVVPPPDHAIVIPAGARFVEVFLTPLKDGFAQMTGLLSSGGSGRMDITAFTVYEIKTSPSSIVMRTGMTKMLSLSLDPPSDIAQTVNLSTKNDVMISIPSTALIPPGGFVDVPVQSFYNGHTTITITTAHSTATVPVTVDVNALVVDSVTPSSGTPDGGSAVTIIGTGLGNTCTVRFGTTLSPHVTFASDRLTATTPAHPPGTVDVVVTCGNQSTTAPHAFTFVRLKRRAVSR